MRAWNVDKNQWFTSIKFATLYVFSTLIKTSWKKYLKKSPNVSPMNSPNNLFSTITSNRDNFFVKILSPAERAVQEGWMTFGRYGILLNNYMFGAKYSDELLLIPIHIAAYVNSMVHTLHISNWFNESTGHAYIFQKVYEYAVHMYNIYIIEILYNTLSESYMDVNEYVEYNSFQPLTNHWH